MAMVCRSDKGVSSMNWYAFDEQVHVGVERSAGGFSPMRIHLFVPGHAGFLEPSRQLRGRCFRSDAEAAAAAVDELRARRPKIFAQ
jgi:hypothetical protein